MRRTASILLAGALALGAVATTDGEDLTDHPCYDEEAGDLVYAEQAVWFHEGEAKLSNGAAAPWDTTPPAASVTEGAGAGALSGSDVVVNSTAGQESVSAVFAGTFEGCIDTILFDLYSFDPTNRSGTGGSGEPAAQDLRLRVNVDGVDVLNVGPVEVATTFSNEAVGPNLNQFAVDLGSLMEQYAQHGYVQLDGTHDVEIEVAAWFVNTQAAVAYVWDTTEVPSGMVFNGAVTEDYNAIN